MGFSYVEVLVATVLIAVSVAPALEALQTGIRGADIDESLSLQHYCLVSKLEQVLAESFGSVISAAEAAGAANTASSYTDSVCTSQRRLVYLSLYDGDADPFTITDPDDDGDANPFTGDTANLLWVRVEIENTALAMESLMSRY